MFQAVYESLANMDTLDKLAQPFGRIIKFRDSLSFEAFDFRFLSRGYSVDNQGEPTSFEAFFDKIEKFEQLWEIIRNLLASGEHGALAIYEHFLDFIVEHVIKSVCLAKTSMMLSDPQYSTISTLQSNMINEDGSMHKTPASIRDLLQDKSMFPMTVSFREIAFIQQYLSKTQQNKYSPVAINALVTVKDSFLLEPHIQLLL
jgi:hypothetical protein